MRIGHGTLRGAPVAAVLSALGACNRHQSALAPFGEDAAQIQAITLVMVVGAIVIAGGVAALMIWAVRAPEGRIGLAGGERLIIIAGGIVPAAVLLALLTYSLPAMRPRSVASGDLQVTVTGEQFWWRVRYEPTGSPALVTANEIRVPVGRTVQFRLLSGDVVHSFWIPGLAGKVDMIPGRENLLAVRATKAGVFRGQCTEFCGLSHALMAFEVVAMPPAAFDAWLVRQRTPTQPSASMGSAVFAEQGCGGCHTIRGTEHAGTIGPDLSHFGQRRTLGAGTSTPTAVNLASFIRHPERYKPGVRMPAFPHMTDTEVRAIAQFLRELR